MTDPRAGEESTTLRQKIEANIEATGDWKGRTPEEVAAHHESIDLDTTPIPEERAGREATEPAKLQADADTVARMHAYILLSASVNGHTKVANELLSKIIFDWSSMKAQLAAQPSVQRDGTEWMVQFEHNSGNKIGVRKEIEADARAVYANSVIGPNEVAVRLMRLDTTIVEERSKLITAERGSK